MKCSGGVVAEERKSGKRREKEIKEIEMMRKSGREREEGAGFYIPRK